MPAHTCRAVVDIPPQRGLFRERSGDLGTASTDKEAVIRLVLPNTNSWWLRVTVVARCKRTRRFRRAKHSFSTGVPQVFSVWGLNKRQATELNCTAAVPSLWNVPFLWCVPFSGSNLKPNETQAQASLLSIRKGDELAWIKSRKSLIERSVNAHYLR